MPITLQIYSPIVAVVKYLQGKTDAGTKVFGGSIPKAEIAAMPQLLITIRSAGGHAEETADTPTARMNVEVDTYGSDVEDNYEAHALAMQVIQLLRSANNITVGSTRLCHVGLMSGPFAGADEAIKNTPFEFTLYDVLYLTEAVA